MNRLLLPLTVCLALAVPTIAASAQSSPASPTIVFLGTGTPTANPKRQGPAFVIKAGNNTYLFDMGVGLMRQAAAASPKVNLSPPTAAFLSHLHTDHTMGLPDLIFTPWSGGNNNTPTSALQLYGPVGLQWMVNNILNAYTQDVCVRNVCERHGQSNFLSPQVTEITLKNTPSGGPTPPPTGSNAPACSTCQACPNGFNCTCGADITTTGRKQVYSDGTATVYAFLVRHGCWDEALGYTIEVSDGSGNTKKIVYSGDTRYTKNVGVNCHGCDVLIHELWWGSSTAPSCGGYDSCFHTSVEGLQQVFNEGKPKKLVVVHQVGSGTASELGIPECSSSQTSNCVIFANDLQAVPF